MKRIYVFDDTCGIDYKDWKNKKIIVSSNAEPILHQYAKSVLRKNHENHYCWVKRDLIENSLDEWYNYPLTDGELMNLMLDLICFT